MTSRAAAAARADRAAADLATKAARYRDATTQADRRRAELNEAIQVAVTAGIPVPEIARVTGLSNARIYQIRDGR